MLVQNYSKYCKLLGFFKAKVEQVVGDVISEWRLSIFKIMSYKPL